MGDINLYQYPISPFSEKLRRVLVHKGLKWNPIDCHYEDKTNLLKITGGKWTRVPVLEWNGEVVWNSADIIKWIDRRVPARPVIPEGMLGLCEVIDQWADNTLFTPILLLVIPDLLDAAGDAKLTANREKLIGMSSAQARQRRYIPRAAGCLCPDDRYPAAGQGFLSRRRVHYGRCVPVPSVFLSRAQPRQFRSGAGIQKSDALV
jgi:glutathione S-transferase